MQPQFADMSCTNLQYSRKAGQSIYPVTEGCIFRIIDSVARFNPKLNLNAEHTLYIWVLRVYRLRKGFPPKRREVGICQMFIPEVQNGEVAYLMKNSRVQMEYLRSKLRDGFETMTTKCLYNYTDYSVKRFYEKIGLI